MECVFVAFTENFIYLKKLKDLSNYQIAKDLDCSQSSVKNWVDGEVIPRKRARDKIARYFGITLAELDGDELPVLPPEGAKKVPAREDEDDLREDQKIMANLLKRMTVEERKNFINAAVAALKE